MRSNAFTSAGVCVKLIQIRLRQKCAKLALESAAGASKRTCQMRTADGAAFYDIHHSAQLAVVSYQLLQPQPLKLATIPIGE